MVAPIHIADIGLEVSHLQKQMTNDEVLLATVSVPISDGWGASYAIKKKQLEVQDVPSR
jgi:hypothetical protein